MNKIIKTILVGLVSIAILASIVGNVYYFGYKQLELNLLQKGFNMAVGQIIQAIKTTGQVQLGEIILIKQNDTTIPTK